MTQTPRDNDPTPLSAQTVTAGGHTLRVHSSDFDQEGLWRPGLRILASLNGVSLKQARRWVLQEGPALADQRQQQRHQERLQAFLRTTWAHAGVPRVFDQVTYASLPDVARNDHAALAACQRWSGVRAEQPGLLLRGSAGNGKTCLAVAALRDYVERTRGLKPVRFRAMSELLTDLQQQYRTHGADGAQSLWQMLSPYAALVVDELGRRRITDWVQEQLHTLFDMCWREAKRLIVTTNVVDASQFDAILDPATQSRLYAMCQEVFLYGPDYRLQVRDPAPDPGRGGPADAPAQR